MTNARNGTPLLAILQRHHACPEALDWVNSKGPCLAWHSCLHGGWMLWALAKGGLARKKLVWLTCDCVALALPHIPAGEDRPGAAIATARRWTGGGATIEEVRAAADTAYTAASAGEAAADAAFAAYAAFFAGRAADAMAAADFRGDAAVCAAHAVGYAAHAVGYAAGDAQCIDAAAQVRLDCARLIRRQVRWATVKQLLEQQD